MTPGPCDICGAARAPFGYAPPPALGIVVRRPLRACAAPACRQAAEDRRAALMARGSAPPPAREPAPPPQADLFDKP